MLRIPSITLLLRCVLLCPIIRVLGGVRSVDGQVQQGAMVPVGGKPSRCLPRSQAPRTRRQNSDLQHHFAAKGPAWLSRLIVVRFLNSRR